MPEFIVDEVRDASLFVSYKLSSAVKFFGEQFAFRLELKRLFQKLPGCFQHRRKFGFLLIGSVFGFSLQR